VVPEKGYRLNFIWISGFERKLSLNMLLFPVKVAASIAQAASILRSFRPDAVVCAGAYVSYPVGMAASMLGVPLVLMASDAQPGLAFRKLARRASYIHVAFESAAQFFRSIGARAEIFLSGNPVRGIFRMKVDRSEARRHFGLDPERPVLFAFGGSLGARSINSVLDDVAPRLRDQGVQIIWQTGTTYQGGDLKEPGLYRSTFINQMDLGYAAADLVLARAGATTVAELAVVAKASVLVPLPIATVHQRENAEAMRDAGAAEMIPDDELREKLQPTLSRLLADPERLRQMGENASRLAVVDADEKIARQLLALRG
jgi:UDP-N-acetylglucosamine--N-acetylmuramyl-(pentapeptide) pyrophosphoryl-undecaprenol N-acetylglucosamine transferase